MFNTVCSIIALICILTEAVCMTKLCDYLISNAKAKSEAEKAQRDKIGRARAKQQVKAEADKVRNRNELFDILSGEREFYRWIQK